MRKIFINVLILATVFAGSILTTDLIHKNIFDSEYENIVATENNSTEEYKYRVSVFNGKIAVFEGNSKVPYKVYDTFVSSLPENDIKILTEGIKINSSAELMKIIEEYTS